VAPEAVNRIPEIQDHPPQKLVRIPGSLTILYYLKQDQNLTEADILLPHSTPREHDTEERPAPRLGWGINFHDVSSIPADPDGKQQPVVEAAAPANLVDHGSSAVVASEPAKDFTAETRLRTVAGVLVEQCCLDCIRLDRDPRCGWTAKDFLSPMQRFLQCLGSAYLWAFYLSEATSRWTSENPGLTSNPGKLY
jgi:hypothetical protein